MMNYYGVRDIAREIEEDRHVFVLEQGIALWDVIEHYDIIGFSNSSIRNVLPVDFPADTAPQGILQWGALLHALQEAAVPFLVTAQPSTSTANAAWSFDRLLDEWRQILPELAQEGK